MLNCTSIVENTYPHNRKNIEKMPIWKDISTLKLINSPSIIDILSISFFCVGVFSLLIFCTESYHYFIVLIFAMVCILVSISLLIANCIVGDNYINFENAKNNRETFSTLLAITWSLGVLAFIYGVIARDSFVLTLSFVLFTVAIYSTIKYTSLDNSINEFMDFVLYINSNFKVKIDNYNSYFTILNRGNDIKTFNTCSIISVSLIFMALLFLCGGFFLKDSKSTMDFLYSLIALMLLGSFIIAILSWNKVGENYTNYNNIILHKKVFFGLSVTFWVIAFILLILSFVIISDKNSGLATLSLVFILTLFGIPTIYFSMTFRSLNNYIKKLENQREEIIDLMTLSISEDFKNSKELNI